MKTLLLTSFLVLSASLAHAGAGCGGGTCTGGDKDYDKSTKTDLVEQNIILAGSGCGGGTCEGSGEKAPKTGFTESFGTFTA